MPDAARGEHDARLVERAHEADEALALVADAVGVGHEGVVEEQLGVDDAAVAELRHRLAERDALVAEADDERRDAARARAGLGLREHDVVLGDAAVRDPRLLPAQPVAALDARRERRHAGGVRAVVGLRRRERGERRALAAQRPQVALLLLLAAELEDRVRRRTRPR